MLVALACCARPARSSRRARSVRSKGCDSAVRDDGARDARREAFLAEFAKDPDELVLARRALTTSAALSPSPGRHAHVERSVLHEAEAARGVVELRRGDAEVEQDAVELEAGLHPVGARAERGKRREEDRDTRIGGEALPRPRQRRGVTIETQQPAVRDELLQNRPCMSAPAKSGVQIGATRPYVQCGQYLWSAGPACVPLPSRASLSPRRAAG